jgi:multiple sugar transport system permease protein
MTSTATGADEAVTLRHRPRLRCRPRRTHFAGIIATYAALIGLGVVMLFPGYWMAVTAVTESGKEFSYPPAFLPDPVAFENFPTALGKWPFNHYFLNSVQVAVLGTIGALITESMAGFAFARLRFPGRDFWFAVCLAVLMLPFVVTMVPRFIIFNQLGMINSLGPLIVPLWFGGSAFGIFLFRQFYRTLPMELDEAAKVDGASPLRIWWSVILPQSVPIAVTLGILHFVYLWNDFMAPLIYLHSEEVKTLPLGVMNFRGQYTQQWNYMMAAALAMSIPVILIVLIGQRHFQRGIALTGLGGR